jgi:hypothetical protein
MIVPYKATLLGLVINSRDMTVSMTEEYVAELHKLLNETWHRARKTFHLNELEVLLGKCACLGESVNWIFHLLIHMHRSTAFALKANQEHLAEKSASFSAYIKRIKQLRQEQTSETKRNIAHINFALKKSAQQVHRLKHKYHINKDMWAEIEFLRQTTAPNSKIRWSTPIGHLIKRDHNWQCHSDACLRSGGGYSINLNFIWFLLWPEPFVRRTLLYLKDDRSKDFISINIWEFISVIMNYCAASVAIKTDGRTCEERPSVSILCPVWMQIVSFSLSRFALPLTAVSWSVRGSSLR